MRILLTIILLFVVHFMNAQKNYHIDSLTDEQVEYEFFYKTKFQLEFASANALLTQGTSINVRGIHIGIQYKHHYKMGVTNLFSQYSIANPNDTTSTRYGYRLGGFGVYFEYVAIENYRWYLSAPFTIANAWVEQTPFDNDNLPISSQRVRGADFAYTSIGVSGGYSVFYWLAIAGGVGYRKSFIDNREINNLLSTPYYNIGVKFRFGRFMKTIMQPDHVLKMKSVYFRDRNRAKSDKFDAKYFELLQKKEQKLKKRDERKAAAN